MRSATIALGLSMIFVSSAHAQSLAELAEREKERRAKSSDTQAKTYTNEDLVTEEATEAELDADREASPSATSSRPRATSGTVADGSKGEAYWRGRAKSAHGRVDTAEKKVASLEAELRRVGGFIPGPQPAACSEGRMRTNTGLTEGPSRVCDPSVLMAQAGQRVHADLERAREELERARSALDGLPNEARRAGALPGWVR